MEAMFSSGASVPLWILGAPLVIALGLLVMNRKRSNRDRPDRPDRHDAPMARPL